MKTQATDREKIFAKCISDNGLASKIYRELLKLSTKKTNNSIKNGQKTWTETSPEKICRWQINIWRHAPHHMAPGKLIQNTSEVHSAAHLPERLPSQTLPIPLGTLIHCRWEGRMVQPLWNTIRQLLAKGNIFLAYNPASILFGIYPEEWEAYVHNQNLRVLHSQCPGLETTEMFPNSFVDK